MKSSRMNYIEHNNFPREVKAICKKHPQLVKGLDAVKRLLDSQFDPVNPVEVIGPSKINRIIQTPVWTIWKVEVAIPNSGLRPSQWPRLWIVVSGDTAALLTIAMHSHNYDNATFENIAKNRATDIF